MAQTARTVLVYALIAAFLWTLSTMQGPFLRQSDWVFFTQFSAALCLVSIGVFLFLGVINKLARKTRQ